MSLATAKPFAVAAWALDEVSGTRVDQVNGYNLTDENTVGSAAGMFGNAADFERDNSEYLHVADNADLSGGDVKFTIVAWVKLETGDVSQSLVSKHSGSHGEYFIQFVAGGTFKFRFIVYGSASFGNEGTVTADDVISIDTWYLVIVDHDPDANQISIQINNGTKYTAAHTAGIYDSTTDFLIGGSSFSEFADALIDDVVVLKGYLLSSEDRTELWNGGAGVAFADWDGGGENPSLMEEALIFQQVTRW